MPLFVHACLFIYWKLVLIMQTILLLQQVTHNYQHFSKFTNHMLDGVKVMCMLLEKDTFFESTLCVDNYGWPSMDDP